MSSGGDFARIATFGILGGSIANKRQAKKGAKTRAAAGLADQRQEQEQEQIQERISADEDLRRQRLFANPIQEEEEEIVSQRKKLLGQ